MDTNHQQDKIDAINTKITQHVITAIEEGIATGVWSPPWAQGLDQLNPVNPVTGKRYTAGNRINLAITAMMFDYGAHWATYDQWASLSRHAGECVIERATTDPRKLRRPSQERCEEHACALVNVARGERGTYALRPIIAKVRDEDGIERERTTGFAPYTVFAAKQVSGYVEPAPVKIDHDDTTAFDEAAAYVERIGAIVEHSDTTGAGWAPTTDVIYMPAPSRWADPEAYWSVLVHELTHWTGHPDRLDRIGCRPPTDMASEVYAREELIAELGSAFHLAHLGRSATVRDDHMQYLAGWLKILKGDSHAIWKAAVFAEAASKELGRRFGIAATKEEPALVQHS